MVQNGSYLKCLEAKSSIDRLSALLQISCQEESGVAEYWRMCGETSSIIICQKKKWRNHSHFGRNFSLHIVHFLTGHVYPIWLCEVVWQKISGSIPASFNTHAWGLNLRINLQVNLMLFFFLFRTVCSPRKIWLKRE